MSLNLYLHESRQSVGSLVDGEIANENGRYQVQFVPTGSSPQPNQLYFTRKKGRYSIFLRHYDPIGQEALPLIEAFDLASGETVPLPHLRFNVLSAKALPRVVSKFIGWHSRRTGFDRSQRTNLQARPHSGKGFFPNHDNEYQIVPLHKKKDEVAILRFKPPVFAQSRQDSAYEVRYWSLALGLMDTRNPYTLLDRKAQVAADGYVYVLVGNAQAPSSVPLFNPIPWLVQGQKAVLLYRNLLVQAHAPLQQKAYRPQGRILSRKEFEAKGFSSLMRQTDRP